MPEDTVSTTRVWQFVNTRRGESWCWREISGNGGVRESSRLFKEFSVSMLDATRNGFRAQEHSWEIHKASGTARYVTGGKVVHLPVNEDFLKNCCTGSKCKPPEARRISFDSHFLHILDRCLDAETRCEARLDRALQHEEAESAAFEAQLLDRYRLIKAQIFEAMGDAPSDRSPEVIEKELADLDAMAERRRGGSDNGG